ncbi:MAG: sel1 repeat family protein [Devosiaceae bacterium]|nr:sel1 repeat family protein [Devosiaceae bacterium MH13]
MVGVASFLRPKSKTFSRAAVAVGLALAAPGVAPVSAVEAQDSVLQNSADPQSLYQQALEAEWSGAYGVARPLLEQAAELGHARAHYQLGFLKMDGLGGPRDVLAARRHFRASADGGHTLALVPLIYAYDDFVDAMASPSPLRASHALLELAQRDLGMAGDTIQFWSRPLRRQIQRDLQAAGFYRGAIDGLIGQGSLNALRGFGRSSAALPDPERAGFRQVIISADGVSVDDSPLVQLAAIETLAEAREALERLSVHAVEENHWRIISGDTELLDWLPAGEQGTVAFQLPGKPRGGRLELGMPKSGVPVDDLGICQPRREASGDAGGDGIVTHC